MNNYNNYIEKSGKSEPAAGVGQYLIYLRKSRQDDPRETVEEVLAKHEMQLQEYADKNLGGRIPEERIYREVVSGERIDEREKMQALLARIEDPNVAGVLVIEPSRLSRGDLLDCGRLIDSFRYTGTTVVTPMMVYHLDNKMERKFFQDELLRGSDYLDYVKEILWRGRVASVKRGCFIAQIAPYGYKKVMVDKNPTLEIIEDQAEVVRLIFRWFAYDMLTPGEIVRRLNEMQVTPPRAKKWNRDTVRMIVRNYHYSGKVAFNQIKTTVVFENGERKEKALKQDEDKIIIAEGLHEAIIDDETWQKAQERVGQAPRRKHDFALKNPLSGLIKCSCCGRAMYVRSYPHANDRLECRNRTNCFKSIQFQTVLEVLRAALEEAELPNLEAKAKNDDGNARKIQMNQVKALEKQLGDLIDQEEKQFELLETGVYTADMFEKRHKAVLDKMDDVKKKIYEAKATMPEAIDYQERVVALKNAIDTLRDNSMTPEEVNKVLRTIIDRIEYTGLKKEQPGPFKGKGTRHKNHCSLEIFLRL